MPFDLDLREAQPVLDNFQAVFGLTAVTEILLIAADKTGAYAEGLISDYPPASGKPLPVYYDRTNVKGERIRSKFKTLRQQHKVMALAAEGKIPYRRTGTLGKSILHSVPVAISPGVVETRIGSKLSYAPYVLDIEEQSHYHRGTWTPIQTDFRNGMPQLQSVVVRAVVNEINRRIKGG
jgi:hypothetical protein